MSVLRARNLVALTACIAVSFALVLPPAACAAPVPASGPDDICAPTDDPCIIDQAYEVQAPGDLNFGSRTVRIVPGGLLLQSVSLTCGDLLVEVGADVTAFDTSEPNNIAGSLDIDASGSIDLNGKVIARGNPGGDVRIFANGTIVTHGRILADGDPIGTSGGFVMIVGDSVTTNGDIITHGLRGGGSYDEPSGGAVVLSADEDVTVNGAIDSSGGTGGLANIDVYGKIFVHNSIDASGGSGISYGSGGYIELYAYEGIQITGSGPTHSKGSVLAVDGKTGFSVGYYTYAYPGYGGTNYFRSRYGDIDIDKKVTISANGGNPGGAGSQAGWLFLYGLGYGDYGGRITFDGTFRAKGYGREGRGGYVFASMPNGMDMGPNSLIDVKSKYGGYVQIDGDQEYSSFQLDGTIDVRGSLKVGNGDYSYYGTGGSIRVYGGDMVVGGKLLNGSDGGQAELFLSGCRLDVTKKGLISARHGTPYGGGDVDIDMEEHVIFDKGSRILADAQGGGGTFIGYGNLEKPPLLAGTTDPPPKLIGVQGSGCPVCGNLEIDVSESCDDGNTTAGDGCNDQCINEGCIAQTPGYPTVALCNDGDGCTVDRCDPITSTCQNIASCEEGVPCTVDTCVAGGCQHTPDDSRCGDFNECTDDLCSATTNCSHVDLTGPGCEDGDLCTVTGTCNGGVCDATDVRLTGDSKFVAKIGAGNGDDKARYKTTLTLDQLTSDITVTGMRLEIRDSNNQPAFASDIPGSAWESKSPGRFTFRDSKGTLASANGVTSVKIKTIPTRDTVKVAVKIKDTELSGVDGQFRVSVSMLFGADPAVEECTTSRFIPCNPRPGKNKCKN